MLRSIRGLAAEGLDLLRLASVLALAPIPGSLVTAVFEKADGLERGKAEQCQRKAFHDVTKASLADIAGQNQEARSVHTLVSRAVRFHEKSAPERTQALRAAALVALGVEIAKAAEDPRLDKQIEFHVAHARQLVVVMPENVPEAILVDGVGRYDHAHGSFAGREWLDERLDAWIAGPRGSRIFCLLGGPGAGKSAIAWHWCYTRKDVIAFHYCVHRHAETADPNRVLLSLAAQIAAHLPEYERRLPALDQNELRETVKGDTRTVFDTLLLKPFDWNFPIPSRDQLVVIDGLDEATTGETNDLAKVIGEVWVGLPYWLRLVVTARPELDVSEYLGSLHPFVLSASSPENMGDIRMFLRRQLTPKQASDDVINQIVAKSEGSFLYAHLVVEEIRAGRHSLDQIAEFPEELTGYYKGWFRRKFPNLESYHRELHELVSVIIAQRVPLPLSVLSSTLGLSQYELRLRLMKLGVLFPLREEHQGTERVTLVTLMHKSLHDWLTGKNSATGLPWAGVFASDLELGNHLLAEEGWRVYCKGALETDGYFREALLTHLAEDNQSDRLVKVLLDPHLVDSLWYSDNRVEWQRHISSLSHTLSLTNLVQDWLKARSSTRDGTAHDAAVFSKLGQLFQEIGACDEARLLAEAIGNSD